MDAAEDVEPVAGAAVHATALQGEVVLASLRLGEQARGGTERGVGLCPARRGSLFLRLEERVVEPGHELHGALVVGVVDVNDPGEVTLVHAAAHPHPGLVLDVLNLLLGDGDGVHHLVDGHQLDGLGVVHVPHAGESLLDVGFPLRLDVDVGLEVILHARGLDGHGALAGLVHVDRLLHQAHHGLPLLALLHGDEPQLGILHRGVQRLLVHRAAHDVPVEPRQVRRVPLLDLLLDLLLVLHALHVLHVLVPGVDALLRLELHRFALSLVQILLPVAVVFVVFVVAAVLLLGDVVDEGARAGPLLLFLLVHALLLFLLVVLLLIRGEKKVRRGMVRIMREMRSGGVGPISRRRGSSRAVYAAAMFTRRWN